LVWLEKKERNRKRERNRKWETGPAQQPSPVFRDPASLFFSRDRRPNPSLRPSSARRALPSLLATDKRDPPVGVTPFLAPDASRARVRPLRTPPWHPGPAHRGPNPTLIRAQPMPWSLSKP